VTFNPKNINILITDGDMKHGLAAIRYLGKEGYNVFAAADKNGLAKRSKYVKKVVFDNSLMINNKLEDLLNEVIENKIDVIIPVSAKSCYFCAEHRSVLLEKTKILIIDFNTINLCLDKKETIEFAKKCGVPYPKTWEFNSLLHLYNNISDIRYPAVVKGKNEFEQRLPNYVLSEKELRNIIKSWITESDQKELPFIVQEFIDGVGRGFFAVYNDGICSHYFMHERIREQPPTGGASTCAVSIFDQDLFEQGKKILDKLKWNGVAMVEFKYDSVQKKHYLIEINPKFWGSLELGLNSGVNFPDIIVKHCLKLPLPSQQYKLGNRFHWPIPDEFKHCMKRPKSIGNVMLDMLSWSTKSNIWIFDLKPEIYRLELSLKNFFKQKM
jgi:predicted ATP-grasp superfamily ATP-dependent carboligase